MIGTKFSKYFKQDIVDGNQTLKPVIIISEIEEEWADVEGGSGNLFGLDIIHKKIRSVYAFTTNRENLIERWPYQGYDDKPLEQITCLKNVSNVKISNDWDRKTLKINRLRFQLHNYYDSGRKLSEVIGKLNHREVRLYYKSPTTNIINHYPDVLSPDAPNEDDVFYAYNCPFIFKGHITRVSVQKDIISITAEDSTEIFMSNKKVPYKTLGAEEVGGGSSIGDSVKFINPSFKSSDIGYPLVYGYVGKSPIIQTLKSGSIREISLITGEISGTYPTSKIPALLIGKNLPSGNSYYLYVKSGDDYLILEHMNASTIEDSIISLYLTGGDVSGENFALPILLGSDGSQDGFGLYDMVGYQQRMVDDSFGSLGGILGIESATTMDIVDPAGDFNYEETDNLAGGPRKWVTAGSVPDANTLSGFSSTVNTDSVYMSDTTEIGDGKYLMLKLSKGVDNELVNIYDGNGSFIGNTFLMSDYYSQVSYPTTSPSTDANANMTGQGWFVAPISAEVLNTITEIRGSFDETSTQGLLDSRQLTLQALLAETPDQLEELATKSADGTYSEVEELIAPKNDTYINAAIFTPENDISGQSKFWSDYRANMYLNLSGPYRGINGLYFGAKTQVNQDILVGESPSIHNNIVMFQYFPPYWTEGSGGSTLSYEDNFRTSTTALLHSVKVEDIRTQEMYGSFIGRRKNRHTEWVDPNTEYAEPSVPIEAPFSDLITNSDGTTSEFQIILLLYMGIFKDIITTDETTKTKPYPEDASMFYMNDGGLEWGDLGGTGYVWHLADWSSEAFGGYDLQGWNYSEYGGEYTGILAGDGMLYSDFQNFLDGSNMNSTIEARFAEFQTYLAEIGCDAPMFNNYTLFRNFMYEYCQIPMRMAHDFNFLFDTQGHNINMIGYNVNNDSQGSKGWFGHPQILMHMLAYMYQVDLYVDGNLNVMLPSGISNLSYYYRWKEGLTGPAYMIKETLEIHSLMIEYMTESPTGYNIQNLDDWISNFYVYMDDVIQAFNHCLRDLEAEIGGNVPNELGIQTGTTFHYDGYPEVTGNDVWPGRENFDSWVSQNQWYYGLSYYETGTQLSGLRSELSVHLYEEEEIVGEPYLTSGVILKPSDIVLNIIDSEMGYSLGDNYENVDQEAIDKSRAAHSGWSMGFSMHKRTNGKKLIEDILKESKSYPTFISNGKFSIITIKEEYDDSDVDKTIKESEIINYNFSQTKIEDIVTSVKAYYNYDHGMKEYTHFEYQNIVDYNTYYDHSSPNIGGGIFLDEGEGGAFNMSHQDIQDNKKGYIELNLKYHTDKFTVQDFVKYTIMNNCLPHNVCELTLSLNNMDIDIGSVIRLPLIQGEKIPSVGSQRDILHVNKYTGETEEFATNYEANSPLDYTKSNLRNGVEIYPYWIVMEKETGINGVKLKAYQLHNLVPIDRNSMSVEWGDGNNVIYGNTNQISTSYFSTGEPIPNWNYNPNATVHQGPEIPYFDITGDGILNINDCVALINHVTGNTILDANALERINSYSSDGSQGDPQTDIVDIIALIAIVLKNNPNP